MEIENNKIFKFKNIIDLREKDEFIKRSIPGSINVSYHKLLVYPDKFLSKNEEYLLICKYGLKSLKVSEILNNMGYCTYSLKGGFTMIK